MAIQIVEIKTKKQQKDFLEFPLRLYKGNAYFVPPLYADEKKMFDERYVYYDQSEAVCFGAYDDGKIVGRIQAIYQRVANEKFNQKRVRFTRFDCYDDQQIANALFDAVKQYALKKGMNEIVGPLGFSDLEREGLLVEGFDQLNTFEEQYNYPYYQKLIENYGFGKDIDWIERRLFANKPLDERIKKLSDMILDKYHLRIAQVKNLKQFVKRYGEKMFAVIDETYARLYGTVPLSDNTKKMIVDNFQSIVNEKFVKVVVDEKDDVVCFGVCFPSISKALQKSGGKLTLPTLVRLLKAIKKPKSVDLGLIGVSPKYESKGVATALLVQLYDIVSSVQYAETNLMLEDNAHIHNLFKHFDYVQHKRRRCFVLRLDDEK